MIGICRTTGDGHWSRKVCDVPILQLEINYAADEDGNETSLLAANYGSLNAYFGTNKWKVNEDGLIYTDSLWIHQFRDLLVFKGFSPEAASAVDYSEQGMQGSDYVNCDVSQPFLKECDPLYQFANGKTLKVKVHNARD